MILHPVSFLCIVSLIAPPGDLCPPDFTEQRDLRITAPTLAIFTHCSGHFDPLHQTRAAVTRVAAKTKQQGYPVLYFHDRHNPSNPYWKYLYSDRNPTAYVSSDIGHYDIDSSHVRHVVSLGGYFWRCQRNSISDAVRLWRRDAANHDLRITQILDGIFDVAEGVADGDPYREKVREYFYGTLRAADPSATISVAKIVELIDDQELAIDFLKRQLPPLPDDVNVEIDYFGRRTMIRAASSKVSGQSPATLTFAYRFSDAFEDVEF